MTTKPERRSTWLTRLVRGWLEKQEGTAAMRRFGGDNKCPWCNQWMNEFTDSVMQPFDGFLDEFFCGNCGGTSLWKWEVGFIFVTALRIPNAYSKRSAFGAMDEEEGVFIKSVKAHAFATVLQNTYPIPFSLPLVLKDSA